MKLYAGRYWYEYHAYGSPFSGGAGSNGAYGVYIQAYSFSDLTAGGIDGAGQNEVAEQSTGCGGGGGVALLVYGSGGVPTTNGVSVSGGTGWSSVCCGNGEAGGNGGNGGNGQILAFGYGANPPITP